MSRGPLSILVLNALSLLFGKFSIGLLNLGDGSGSFSSLTPRRDGHINLFDVPEKRLDDSKPYLIMLSDAGQVIAQFFVRCFSEGKQTASTTLANVHGCRCLIWFCTGGRADFRCCWQKDYRRLVYAATNNTLLLLFRYRKCSWNGRCWWFGRVKRLQWTLLHFQRKNPEGRSIRGSETIFSTSGGEQAPKITLTKIVKRAIFNTRVNMEKYFSTVKRWWDCVPFFRKKRSELKELAEYVTKPCFRHFGHQPKEEFPLWMRPRPNN